MFVDSDTNTKYRGETRGPFTWRLCTSYSGTATGGAAHSRPCLVLLRDLLQSKRESLDHSTYYFINLFKSPSRQDTRNLISQVRKQAWN